MPNPYFVNTFNAVFWKNRNNICLTFGSNSLKLSNCVLLFRFIFFDVVCENVKEKFGSWHFPELNFDSMELREYLWENMEYFMKEFKVDGYRCDVAPAVPLDFWEEGRKRMEAIKADCIMISEGDCADDQLSAFDVNYAFPWKYNVAKLLRKEITAKELREIWEKMNKDFLKNARFLRILDDHDIANDCYEKRHNAVFSPEAVEAILYTQFYN